MAEFTERFSVVKDFTARLNDELSIVKGDIVELISDDSEFGDGWYMGKNLSNGEVGLYPKVFTKRLERPSDLKLEKPQIPGILRSRSRRTPNQSPINASFSSSFLDVDGGSEVSTPTEVKGVHGYVNDIDNALKQLSMDSHIGNDMPEVGNSAELNTNEVDLWSPYQVGQYFNFLGFDNDISNKFIKHKISGGILMELELSHLKELDIDSFGTRYEVFKEIEELKKAFNNNSSGINRNNNKNNDLVPKQFKQDDISVVDDQNTPIVLLNNRSSESIESHDESNKERQNVTPDLNVNSSNNNNNEKFNSNQFLSPRRAPQPPSYPSPVASNPMKFGLNSPEKINRVPQSMLIVPQTNTAHSRNSSIGAASSIYVDTSSQNLKSPELASSSSGGGFSHKLEAAGNRISSRFSTIINGSGFDFDSSNNTSNRRSVSAKEFSTMTNANDMSDPKRVQSTNTVLIHEPMSASSGSSTPSTATATAPLSSTTKSSTFKSFTQRKPLAKTQTSAFQEGIQNINVEDAIKTASFSGWMFKRGNISIGSWKHRFFTLHKTRLSYFTSLTDTKERGLIDITSHKVLPANDTEDKLSAVYAATAGYGRYMFKIVPPAPGSRMGLTFTQQKVHYFAVESKEEMREWMSALMKATIEVDESIPVISSCVTPTIPLQKAQELMAIARETAQENLEKLQRQREGGGVTTTTTTTTTTTAGVTTTFEDTSNSTSTPPAITLPRSSSMKDGISQLTNGMSTPYLVTSGLMAPNNPNNNGGDSIARKGSFKSQQIVPPIVTRLDSSEFTDASPSPSQLSHSNSFRRVLSLRRNK